MTIEASHQPAEGSQLLEARDAFQPVAAAAMPATAATAMAAMPRFAVPMALTGVKYKPTMTRMPSRGTATCRRSARALLSPGTGEGAPGRYLRRLLAGRPCATDDVCIAERCNEWGAKRVRPETDEASAPPCGRTEAQRDPTS